VNALKREVAVPLFLSRTGVIESGSGGGGAVIGSGSILLAALLGLGWVVKRQSGSHRTLSRAGWPDFVFAFHDGEEIGPKMLSRIAKHTGLSADDL